MGYAIGIDVGGTFTDVVCSDGVSTWRAKSPTNPQRFADGVLGGCRLIASQVGLSLEDLLKGTVRLGLGTTAVTNVLATQRGHRVGVLTTTGFEDHLHTARGAREGSDGWLVLPWNPVSPDWVAGISERVDRDGKIVRRLDADEVAAAAQSLVQEHGVDAFAVSFLWAFKNPIHEVEAEGILRKLFPNLPVFLGSKLRPLKREYERTTLAVLNAFCASALDGVEELEAELHRLGLEAPVLLLHSGGGAISVGEARSEPLGLASSGPAAGAVAAAEVARAAGIADALCCDMGGTSIDVAVVREGAPERRQSAHIHGIVTGQAAVDVESIGAGGGSIAWIDSRGLLRVGPRSARATPGPVCYGRGGTEATVTDAMVLLGYIDPNAFMGGAMKLDVEAAREACQTLGDQLGLSAIEVAFGIREIALAEMSKAIKARIATGGLDARKFSVIAFGGSGSLFAPSLARQIGLKSVLTPSVASVLSAYGAATADIRRERTRAVDALLPAGGDDVRRVLAELSTEVVADLEQQGVRADDRTLIAEVDVRFYRQKSYLTLAVDPADFDAEDLLQRFTTAYADRYGQGGVMDQTQVELSTLRVIGIGRTVRAVLPADLAPAETGAEPPHTERLVFLERDRPVPVPVFDATLLRQGHAIRGPALIDAGDTTLWAPPGSTVEVGAGRSLVTCFHDAAN